MRISAPEAKARKSDDEKTKSGWKLAGVEEAVRKLLGRSEGKRLKMADLKCFDELAAIALGDLSI